MDVLGSGFVLEIEHIVVAGLAAIMVKVLDVIERRLQKVADGDDRIDKLGGGE